MATSHTFIGARAGFRFYEHGTRGDESPVLIRIGDSFIPTDSWGEIPPIEDIAGIVGDYVVGRHRPPASGEQRRFWRPVLEALVPDEHDDRWSLADDDARAMDLVHAVSWESETAGPQSGDEAWIGVSVTVRAWVDGAVKLSITHEYAADPTESASWILETGSDETAAKLAKWIDRDARRFGPAATAERGLTLLADYPVSLAEALAD